MGPFSDYLIFPLLYIAVAIVISLPSRWILIPFIAFAGWFAVVIVSEPWFDSYFWSAVRAEKGWWYHPAYSLVLSLPFVTLTWLFIRRSRKMGKAQAS